MKWDWLAMGYLFCPIVGFFGTQAVRLLRESWDGVVRAQKNGEIRPHGATSLADELYSMLDDNIPQTQNAPVTINVPPNSTGLTINGNLDSPSFTVNGGVSSIKGSDIAIGGPNPGNNSFNANIPTNITIGKGPTTTAPGDNLTLNGSNLSFGPIDIMICPPAPPGQEPSCSFHATAPSDGTINGIPLSDILGGGTSTFLGRVVSGTGAHYTVALYAKGSALGVTDTVSATVPQIDPAEQIPPDTWIDCVHQFAVVDDKGNATFTFEFQPPVWLGA